MTFDPTRRGELPASFGGKFTARPPARSTGPAKLSKAALAATRASEAPRSLVPSRPSAKPASGARASIPPTRTYPRPASGGAPRSSATPARPVAIGSSPTRRAPRVTISSRPGELSPRRFGLLALALLVGFLTVVGLGRRARLEREATEQAELAAAPTASVAAGITAQPEEPAPTDEDDPLDPNLGVLPERGLQVRWDEAEQVFVLRDPYGEEERVGTRDVLGVVQDPQQEENQVLVLRDGRRFSFPTQSLQRLSKRERYELDYGRSGNLTAPE